MGKGKVERRTEREGRRKEEEPLAMAGRSLMFDLYRQWGCGMMGGGLNPQIMQRMMMAHRNGQMNSQMMQKMQQMQAGQMQGGRGGNGYQHGMNGSFRP